LALTSGDYPRPNGYGNKHRRYPAQHIRASQTNFLSDSARTQNYCSRNNSFVQNDRRYLANQLGASPTIYLSSERYGRRTQNYWSRNNGFVQNNERYSADRVRASRTNFGGTQNSYSRNQSFAQNIRRVNVENHHHQNHSESPASEPSIEHTDKVKVTDMNIYNNYGDLVKVSYRAFVLSTVTRRVSRSAYIIERCGCLGKKRLWFKFNGARHKKYCRPVYAGQIVDI